MEQLKEEKIRKFAGLGVAEADIFREIMRARHLDYVLFSQPSNREYGLTQEALFEAAQKLTAEKLGVVPGDVETYAAIYTLALSVDPMMFAETAPVSAVTAALVRRAAAEAEKAGQTVLLRSGAVSAVPDGYFRDAAGQTDRRGSG